MKQEVDLLQYLPGFLQEIREFRELSKAESPEFDLLYQAADTLLGDGFLWTAGQQGIKRWETLLNIPSAGLDLNVRRAAILGKWNRTIPYTMVRLYEYLDALAAREDYQIKMSSIDCRLELVAKDLPLYTLRAMRDLVRAMLPANMVFGLADRIPGMVDVLVDVQARLRLTSGFYPRYNTPLHCLDGTTRLDGTYLLNGYLSGKNLDFYPLSLQISGDTSWPEWQQPSTAIFVTIHPQITLPVAITADLDLLGDATVRAQSKSRFYLLSKIGAASAVAGQVAVRGSAPETITRRASLLARGAASASTNTSNKAGMSGSVEASTAADGSLVVEKDLWRLDGSVRLDGSRILDAEIYTENIT